MRPNKKYLGRPKSFWAHVRTISEAAGYTVRGQGQVKVSSLEEMKATLQRLGLATTFLCRSDGSPTANGLLLREYLQYRADILNDYVEPRLMNVDQARKMFKELKDKHSPRCPIPGNKQKGKKKGPAYLTAMVNIIVEARLKGLPCEYDPRTLTTITKKGIPLRTLARRIDGAFPGAINPIAIWEIKEYYHTTTFGSRVADGVYESLLDGMELEELREHERVDIKHYLIIDAHYTWWKCGRSYLCRLIDMLHMGYVDEVLFGREVAERLPQIVDEWIELSRTRSNAG